MVDQMLQANELSAAQRLALNYTRQALADALQTKDLFQIWAAASAIKSVVRGIAAVARPQEITLEFEEISSSCGRWLYWSDRSRPMIAAYIPADFQRGTPFCVYWLHKHDHSAISLRVRQTLQSVSPETITVNYYTRDRSETRTCHDVASACDHIHMRLTGRSAQEGTFLRVECYRDRANLPNFNIWANLKPSDLESSMGFLAPESDINNHRREISAMLSGNYKSTLAPAEARQLLRAIIDCANNERPTAAPQAVSMSSKPLLETLGTPISADQFRIPLPDLAPAAT
jgi:hypothetical protein